MNELMIIQDATCWNNIAVDYFGVTKFLMINMMTPAKVTRITQLRRNFVCQNRLYQTLFKTKS